MNVRELREQLELIDGECEIIIHDRCTNTYEIETMGLDVWYEKLTDNRKTPYCIKIS